MSLILRKLSKPLLFSSVNLPVTKEILATDSPKGIYGPILKFKNLNRIHRRESEVYRSKHIILRFYPTSHFIALFRKTKPSLNVKCSVGESFLDECGQYIKNVYTKKKSVIPSNYAVWRRKIKLLVKKPFIQEWYRLQGPEGVMKDVKNVSNNSSDYIPGINSPTGTAKDGFYEFQIVKYPNTEKENEIIEKDVKAAVSAVANLVWEDFLAQKPSTNKNKHKNINKIQSTNWVESSNNTLKISSLNSFLKHSNIPFELVKEEKLCFK